VAIDAKPALSPRLLIVEDDRRLAQGLSRNLVLEGFRVAEVSTGEAALAQVAGSSPPYDLVILDIMLPGVDGLEVCRRLRQSGDSIPILFLTARGSEGDRLLGLRLGADDYLVKPFVFEELVLRVRGILRRAAWSRSPTHVGPTLRVGAATVDLSTMQATGPGGSTSLTEREVLLLRFLAENEGRVLTRGELLERVWGYSFDTATRTLDTFVHRLRRTFEEDPRIPRHFHTVRGVGYRFTRDPED